MDGLSLLISAGALSCEARGPEADGKKTSGSFPKTLSCSHVIADRINECELTRKDFNLGRLGMHVKSSAESSRSDMG